MSITCSISSPCMDSLSQIAAGYYCSQSVCYQCPVGTYGTTGETCISCPYATWAPNLGQSSCGTSFTFTSTSELQKAYIPYGVGTIGVQLWGGGGGGDHSNDPSFVYLSRSGGGGGYASCNISVASNTSVYVIVAGGGRANATGIRENFGGT